MYVAGLVILVGSVVNVLLRRYAKPPLAEGQRRPAPG
jgi:hypothetical protein